MLGIVCQIGLLWLSTNTFKRRLDTYWQDQEIIYDFMHSHKEPEVVVKYLNIIKYHIGYVKVWNEADIEA